ncbi:MAG: glycoside hydrolase family 2 [Chloroflexota bacterium]|nr:glycoside hydrolase family 2 [Chloroflexota bacterium]
MAFDSGRFVHAYPRPQLRRTAWASLNGFWDFAFGEDAWNAPHEVRWGRKIRVPFAPESPASGIGDTGFHPFCWYRRTFRAPTLQPHERLLVHFGAVDYAATVWVNGDVAVRHTGGYTPFTADITPFLADGDEQEIVVLAGDDPADLEKPRGKQDWQREPHAIWYPRTSGIWQTVWLERASATRIANLRWTSNLERWEIGLEAFVAGASREGLRLKVRLSVGSTVLADDTYTVVNGEVHRRIALSDPGVDDFRNELLWSPMCPTLIDARVELWGRRGELLDAVDSYTALRAVAVQGDQFLLNGRPYRPRLALDQGYWPESGLTPPSDEALRRDVTLAKAMGFNGVRKHQKIEDPRYLYWADALGLMVWGEMPSAYRFTERSVERVTREWMEVLRRDVSHPCIVAWVPFNESWGVPDLPAIAAQRHYVQALYHLTHTIDPDRPVIGNDGWESVATDILAIHDYDDDLDRLARRYASEEVLPNLFRRERPGGRRLTVEGYIPGDRPIMLTEFGGIAYAKDESSTWGYTRVHSPEELADHYRRLLEVVRSLPLLAGFCYTQLTDTYQEANGLLYFDRTPKVPLDKIRHATRGDGRDERFGPDCRDGNPAAIERSEASHAGPPPESWAEATT